MKIAIISKMPFMHYSGGRYHAWNIGESLAHTGNDVYFIANNKPIFFDDFAENVGHTRIKLIITKDFNLEELPNEIPSELDFVIMVPHRSLDLSIYIEAKNFCKRKKAKQILLNFESPNWMNQYVQNKIDPELWDGWKFMCKDECIVLSTDKEGEKYAKEFYGVNNNIFYEHWNLSINSLVANHVKINEKEKRIITFIRLTDEHKGGFDILESINESMRGYTFVFVYGASKRNDLYNRFVEKLEELRHKFGIEYEMKIQLSEHDKFEELARAKYMLFPSYFEGYGLPPIEAMYMETICLAYDLPVLREICGDGLVYCKHGDYKEMAQKLEDMIKTNYKISGSLRDKIKEIADFNEGANRIDKLLRKYYSGE